MISSWAYLPYHETNKTKNTQIQMNFYELFVFLLSSLPFFSSSSSNFYRKISFLFVFTFCEMIFPWFDFMKKQKKDIKVLIFKINNDHLELFVVMLSTAKMWNSHSCSVIKWSRKRKFKKRRKEKVNQNRSWKRKKSKNNAILCQVLLNNTWIGREVGDGGIVVRELTDEQTNGVDATCEHYNSLPSLQYKQKV